MIIKNVTPERIVARAAVVFGKPYQQLWVRRTAGTLTSAQHTCMVDMECLAELDLLRMSGEIPDQEPQTGLLV